MRYQRLELFVTELCAASVSHTRQQQGRQIHAAAQQANRRVTKGVELASRPAVMQALDEPSLNITLGRESMCCCNCL